MTLLMEKDILSEEMSRFYIAEAILAVESVHNLNYIHRDLKPDNLIIGKDGHVKLSDFGLCKHVEIKPKSKNINEHMRNDLSNIVKESVDWWSCGAILFEMLVGYPPFFSDEPSVTC